MNVIQLRQKQTQKQALSPLLTRYMQLLPLSYYTLRNFVRQVAEENPLLERCETQEEPYDFLTGEIRDEPWEGEGAPHSQTGFQGLERAIERRIASEDPNNTMIAMLRCQLYSRSLPAREERIALSLINALDKGGYFRENLGVFAKTAGCPEELALRMLRLIQSFLPRGVGARNLAECLILQLPPDYQFLDIARRMLEEDKTLVESRQTRALAYKHSLSLAHVQSILDRLRRLNPHPCSLAEHEGDIQYIYPDIVIRQYNRNREIAVRGRADELIRLNTGYERDLAGKMDGETRRYLSQKKRETRELVAMVNMRHRALTALSRYLVSEQTDYFRYGEQYIRPCAIQQTAKALNCHPTTVNRCIANKHIETPWGIYPIRHFFSQSVSANSVLYPTGVSASAVHEMIRQIIVSEKSDKALPDQRITDILAESGVYISRRTVAKYRSHLHLESSHQRKKDAP
jgi:RNA polymerase sigma-54 factor